MNRRKEDLSCNRRQAHRIFFKDINEKPYCNNQEKETMHSLAFTSLQELEGKDTMEFQVNDGES